MSKQIKNRKKPEKTKEKTKKHKNSFDNMLEISIREQGNIVFFLVTRPKFLAKMVTAIMDMTDFPSMLDFPKLQITKKDQSNQVV